MDHLPQDPAILCSSVNMLLRDGEYDTLEELCAQFDQDPAQLKEKMHAAGYRYDEPQKQFKIV